jgi:hypothetical protein
MFGYTSSQIYISDIGTMVMQKNGHGFIAGTMANCTSDYHSDGKPIADKEEDEWETIRYSGI